MVPVQSGLVPDGSIATLRNSCRNIYKAEGPRIFRPLRSTFFTRVSIPPILRSRCVPNTGITSPEYS